MHIVIDLMGDDEEVVLSVVEDVKKRRFVDELIPQLELEIVPVVQLPVPCHAVKIRK